MCEGVTYAVKLVKKKSFVDHGILNAELTSKKTLPLCTRDMKQVNTDYDGNSSGMIDEIWLSEWCWYFDNEK